jgi:hypothetical protein
MPGYIGRTSGLLADRDVRGDLEALFPRLRDSGYAVTSEYASGYNCVAYIADDRLHRWEPEERGGWYWPPGLPKNDFTLSNYIRCFEYLNFRRCVDDSLEDGVEKIAVFVDDEGEFSHVSRQLEDGWWSSKLGFYEDISHPSNEVLLAGRPLQYGENLILMARRRETRGAKRTGLILLA